MNDTPPIDDHYATLGVAPRSEHTVIRAAYVALMRRYHPDTSSAPTTARRAQEIIAAFAVLGHPERRLEYDWQRRRAAEALVAPRSLPGRKLALGATVVVLLSLVSLALLWMPHAGSDRPPPARRAEPVSFPAATPAIAPASRRAPAAVAPTPSPARVSPPTAIPAPIAPARTIARTAPRVPPTHASRTAAAIYGEAATPVAAANRACRVAGNDPSTTTCNDENLAALDRLALAFYGQSLRVGDVTTRAALQVSRTGFLARLQACRSEPCLRSAYLTHMREISAIVEKRPQL